MSEDPNPYEGMSFSDMLIEELSPEYNQRRRTFLERRKQRGDGSRRARRTYINRDHEEGDARLFNDYFAEEPLYSDFQFRRRFRMRREVFLRIVNELESRYSYFQQKLDACGKKGFSTIQKCTAAIRMLSYGAPADELDEYLRIAEYTAIECTRKFVNAVVEVFGEH